MQYQCAQSRCIQKHPSIPPGKYALKVSDSGMGKIGQALERSVEFGGVFSLNPLSMEIDIPKLSRWGEKSTVNIPHGILEFHTHPSSCTPQECYMDMPSLTDMTIITTDFMQGNVWHVVFGQLGTYCVKVGEKMQKHILRMDAFKRKSFVRRVLSRFDSFQKKMGNQTKVTVAKRFLFQKKKEWLHLARELGFVVKYYKRGIAPILHLRLS